MITEAEIQTIDFNSNSCTVRIPLFETVNTVDSVTVEAKFAIVPGFAHGYKVNDTVWVAFENGKPGQPIVIGKVFVSAEEEAKDGGSFTCEDFTAIKSASLPNTTIVEKVDSNYNTLNKIVNNLKSIYNFLGINPTNQNTAKPNGRYCVSIINEPRQEFVNIYTCKNYNTLKELVDNLVAQKFTSVNRLYTAVGEAFADIIGIFVDPNYPNTISLLWWDHTGGPLIIDENTQFICTDISNI